MEFTRTLRRVKRKLGIQRPFVSALEIRVVADEEVYASYKEISGHLPKNITLVREYSGNKVRRYLYQPKEHAMEAAKFLQAMWVLAGRDLDYIVVSGTLDDYPVIGAAHPEDAILYSPEHCGSPEAILKGERSLCGRILRLPGAQEVQERFEMDPTAVTLQDQFFLISKEKGVPGFHGTEVSPRIAPGKKMVFVMPIFLAVGGVERNTIEMMKALRDTYSFCLITTERLAREQGSLHHQLRDLCVAQYDLREMEEYENHLSFLATLRDMYRPDIVWLCNNSDWLEEHLSGFREVFREQRIIAQDVYDTEAGWIRYYDRHGIRMLDGYIAVNDRIRVEMKETYRLPEEKIKLIYPAVNLEKIKEAYRSEESRDAVLERYDLDTKKKHFALIGRMTEQKDPLRYLQMIEALKERHGDTEFVLVGDGHLSRAVDSYIEEHGLPHVVKHISYVEHVPGFLKGMDGLILTSQYEGQAIVSIESMCMGVPILSTDNGDMELFLTRTGGGAIIGTDETDEEAFRNWYTMLADYKAAAIAHAEEMQSFFSTETLAGLYRDIFEGN